MGGSGALFLGTAFDPESGKAGSERLELDSRDLTTHGVIVGMTGSGKTGLAVVMLEEALLAGIPVLVLDPKGDMTNLALTFPDLSPEQFRPWVNEADATAQGLPLDGYRGKAARGGRGGPSPRRDRQRACRSTSSGRCGRRRSPGRWKPRRCATRSRAS